MELENKFKKTPTGIEGLFIVEPIVFGDARGFFMETWNEKEFENLGLPLKFVQDNHSRSRKGILRGLHLQKTHGQGKLVRCVRGKVFDVAVDLREGSETFGKYFGIILSEENKKMFYIPEGFAHGFLALSDEVDFLYKATDYYFPEGELGVNWDDPEINISWPLKEFGLGPEDLILSEKDKKNLSFEEYKNLKNL